MKMSLIAVAAILASTGFCCAQDLAAGETQFKKCAPCHDVGDKAKNKIGPMLNGIEGSWADADQKAAWREQWPAAFDALVDETDWPLPASFGR